jgi:peptide/nickel transport system ATP-binding protein
MTLAVEALSIAYAAPGGEIGALDQVSLAIARGGAMGLVGESGSGKSTVGLAIMGLLPAEASVRGGAIRFGDRDLLALDADSRRRLRGDRIALVFQDPFTTLNPALRVGEQIGEGLVHHRGRTRAAAREAAIALLGEVGIREPRAVADAYPHQLSGGMRQRALIASALACEPELLILDEPTTALDVTIEAQLLDLLAELRAKRGLSVLLISHNLGVVRRVCESLTVIYAGRVVEQGATAEIFARPAHPYTRGLLAAIPRIGARKTRLASIAGRLPDLGAPLPGCAFAPRCPFAEPACVQEPQRLASHDARLVSCWQAARVASRDWPQGEGTPPASPGAARPEHDATIPVAEAQGASRDFILGGGLAGLRLRGWRPAIARTRVRAVHEVDLAIAPGEVVGLVGESGSGKTTLGRLLLRLVDPTAGRIALAGRDVTVLDQRTLAPMRRHAQIVFQNPDSSLNPRKTIGELIARPLQRFAIVPPDRIAHRVAELLDLVRLPASYVARYPHQLSGGEKQRVGIARALASEPDFVVCDEPVSALDVSVQAAIVNLLAELRERLRVAYLFISHDISVVAHLADRIAVMYRGGLVEIGPADRVLSPPFHPYTEALLSAVPRLDGAPAARIRLREESSLADPARGCSFAGRCPRRIGTICDTTAPAMRAHAEGHRIACHLD